jgi:hypothetical protein
MLKLVGIVAGCGASLVASAYAENDWYVGVGLTVGVRYEDYKQIRTIDGTASIVTGETNSRTLSTTTLFGRHFGERISGEIELGAASDLPYIGVSPVLKLPLTKRTYAFVSPGAAFVVDDRAGEEFRVSPTVKGGVGLRLGQFTSLTLEGRYIPIPDREAQFAFTNGFGSDLTTIEDEFSISGEVFLYTLGVRVNF